MITTYQQFSTQAALICPISGLVTNSNLPPLPHGKYLELQHPLVQLILPAAKTSPISIDWHYMQALPTDLKAGAFLALMHALGKIQYLGGSNAFATRLAMQATFDDDALAKALGFIKDRVKKGATNFPALLVRDSYINPNVWNDFITQVTKADRWAANAYESLTEGRFLEMAGGNADDGDEYRIKPRTSKAGIKARDKACYELYLELGEYLPAATKAKAATFVKKLASFQNGALIESFLNGIAKYFEGQEDGMATYKELVDTVMDYRTTGEEQGTIVTAEDFVGAGIVAAMDEPKKPLSIKERIALKKQGSAK